MDPIEIAAEYFDKERRSILSVERIKSGLTNESWLVRAEQDGVVVRLSNREVDALQIDRQSESRILAIIAAAGIGAPILLCVPDRHLLVTRHIPGRTWSARDARLSENLVRVAEVLRALHALPVPENVQSVDLRKVISGYWNSLMARGLGSQVGAPEVRERARQLVTQLAEDATLRLCHNDVHHLNLIDDGRLWLIDWEYAGVGDSYFDLASVCCYHSLSDDVRRDFLRAYLGYDSTASFDRLQRMCWVFNYIRELWFAVREME
jgi:thiamine kinase